jgi:CIC family chloride channel protein
VSIVIYAVLIGIVTAFVSIIFNFLVENLVNVVLYINNYFFSAYYFPIFGGFILGIINKYIITDDRDFEIVAIEHEISNVNVQLLKFKNIALKTIASVISLGFGFSLGKQGTIIYLGGSIGSLFAFELDLPKEDIKTYIGCGVAGMISGVFGLPLLGIVLVNEILIERITLRRILLTGISVVTSYIIFYIYSNNEMFFTVYNNGTNMMNYDIRYIVLIGLLAGFVSILYNQSVNKISDDFLNKWPMVTPLIAGIIITLVGLNMKEIYILHFNSIEELILGDNTIMYLILYIIIKIILTGISYNFGGYGGVFLPGIIIGAVLGKSYFLATGCASMDIAIILAVAGVFTGFSGGPISGIVLGFELSGYNCEMIFPLVIVSYISYFIVKGSKVKFLY